MDRDADSRIGDWKSFDQILVIIWWATMHVDLVDIDGWKSFVTYDHLAGHDHACNIIGMDGWE